MPKFRIGLKGSDPVEIVAKRVPRPTGGHYKAIDDEGNVIARFPEATVLYVVEAEGENADAGKKPPSTIETRRVV